MKKTAKKAAVAPVTVGDVVSILAPSQPVEYMVVEAHDAAELNRRVNDLFIRFDGTVWVPQGGKAVKDGKLIQALARFE